MCGIVGAYAFQEEGKKSFSLLDNAVQQLHQRGPDAKGTFVENNVALGHARLSIIDTSNAGAQPFTDDSGRYTLAFNGEFYNYQEHRNALSNKGISFRSTSDTEVLLQLFIAEGPAFLEKINGFFALAIYDKEKDELFIARDRFGIKPLLIYQAEDRLLFASEMKALLALDIPKVIDEVSLYTYLQLNYIPPQHSIFKNVRKLEAGHYWIVNKNGVQSKQYYSIDQSPSDLSYEEAQQKLKELLEHSVQQRLVADVPLGAFLSGGIDSSVITALAAKHSSQLNTFSIGYKDEPLFDETQYAELVAKKHNTNHTVFSLSNDDLYANLHEVLNYIDEPFADSSALAVHILSMHTRKHVTVALSGDGADEIFSGYNKHMAEFRARQKGILASLLQVSSPLLKHLPQSRNSKLGNKIRQFNRFAEGLNLSADERYFRWAGYLNEKDAKERLTEVYQKELVGFQERKKALTKNIQPAGGINDMLLSDAYMVLQGDMLTKVDLMSMANSLEVRVPFLDHQVVDFAFSLPSNYKIDQQRRKKILKDAFRNELPPELYTRGKHGFEVPLLKWFQTELRSTIEDDLLAPNFIKEQGIFNVDATELLKRQLFSNNPGDAAAQIWGLIVFQHWWKRTIA